MPMLEVSRLSVQFGQKKIVDGLSFTVEEGQWLMIVGPNGAGKSTALNAVTQGVPYTGRVLFEGQDVAKMKPALRAQAIGVLAQNHFVGYSFTVERSCGSAGSRTRAACSAAARQRTGRRSSRRSPSPVCRTSGGSRC